ncbi:cell division protein FtsL [Flavimaricola marinus]|uniref:Cell division protein FtsL n=1 Tax=Flavimaricola marinus TaxID=1819565 RepID=A0A238LDB6_9RHOB|nr:cell division protein FtsL [Flavimaricola marinus]SMY07707.1 hypothetical protein LOM8899_01847 [Flavimaricola marinus]
MRGFLNVAAFLAVIGLAFWAYQQNYQTQEQLREVRQLHAQIGSAHARLKMLNAEWAYLNRPDRLRDLADLNFDRLGLVPMSPEAFGRVEQVDYPIMPLGLILDPIEVSSDGGAASDEDPL